MLLVLLAAEPRVGAKLWRMPGKPFNEERLGPRRRRQNLVLNTLTRAAKAVLSGAGKQLVRGH